MSDNLSIVYGLHNDDKEFDGIGIDFNFTEINEHMNIVEFTKHTPIKDDDYAHYGENTINSLFQIYNVAPALKHNAEDEPGLHLLVENHNH